MTVAAFNLTRSDWRAYAYAIDNITAAEINTVFSYTPELAIFASQELGSFGGTKMAGRGHTTVTGGPALLWFPTLGVHQGAGRAAGAWGTHNVAPDDNKRPAEANWKFYNQGLAISDHDLNVNAGTSKFADFLRSQTMDALRSIADLVADDITNTSAPATAINSIPELLNTNDTIHGLSGATYSTWNTRGVTARGTVPASITYASGSFAGGIALPDLRTAYHNASEGSVQPDIHLTSYENLERLESVIQPQERYEGGVGMANTGFTSLSFMGKPVLASPKVSANASGDWYMLSLDKDQGIQFKCLAGSDFTWHEWKPSTTQLAMVRPISVTCELTIGNRRFGSNKVTSLTD